MKTKSCSRVLGAGLLALAAVAAPGAAAAQAVDFAGKTVTLLHNTPPGSSVDVFGRQIGPYLVKNLPGRPQFVVVAKPGGRFLLGAAHLHRNTEPDGLTMGMLAQLHGQAATRVQISFPLTEFAYLGGMAQTYIFYARKDLGLASADQLAKPPNTIILGGAAPNSNTQIMWRLFMGAVARQGSYKQIFGLQGQQGQLKALRSNDANMASMLGSLFLQLWPGLKQENLVVPLYETGELDDKGNVEATSGLGIPTMDAVWRKLAAGKVDTKEYRAFRKLLTSTQLTWVFALPPKTPQPLVATWSGAFAKALADPGLRADLEKANTVLPRWTSGAETTRLVSGIADAGTDPEYQAALDSVFVKR